MREHELMLQAIFDELRENRGLRDDDERHAALAAWVAERLAQLPREHESGRVRSQHGERRLLDREDERMTPPEDD